MHLPAETRTLLSHRRSSPISVGEARPPSVPRLQNIPRAFPQLHIMRIDLPIVRRHRTLPEPITADNIHCHRSVRLRWERGTACFFNCMPEASAAHSSEIPHGKHRPPYIGTHQTILLLRACVAVAFNLEPSSEKRKLSNPLRTPIVDPNQDPASYIPSSWYFPGCLTKSERRVINVPSALGCAVTTRRALRPECSQRMCPRPIPTHEIKV